MKTLFDLILASLLLVLILPFLIIVAILVYISLGSPVLFKQQRPGLMGKPFYLYKFRTMTLDRAPNGKLLDDGARLTPLGRFLRKFSLDELPQLINVLKGDMSFVGPRPLLMEYLPLYTYQQARRHGVKPGITGWAQVRGRNALSWDDKFSLDVWYVDHRTFRLDLYILWLTFIKVIRSEGISQKGHATMPEFKGGNHNNNEGI